VKFIAPLIAFLGLAVVLMLGLQRDPRALPSALIDQPLPAIDIPLLQNPEQRFDSTALRGQVWMLNVWASWCGPCQEELPALNVLAHRDRVPLYGLNYKDQPAPAQALLARFGNPYRSSAVDADGRVGMDLGVHGVPETFVIDAAGRVRYRHLGPVNNEIWETKLMPVVKALQ